MTLLRSPNHLVRLCVTLLVSFRFSTWPQQVSIGIELLYPTDNSVTLDTRPTDDPLISHDGDLSIPNPLSFYWNAAEGTPPIVYSLYVSKDSILDSTDRYAAGITETFYALWNLEINRKYFWMVSAKDDLGNSGNSSLQSFTTAAFWPRMLYIDGTTNVRDIGGCSTMEGKMIQQGLLYRSAEFNYRQCITEKGLEQLRRHGIVSEIDLKTNIEKPENVIPWLPRYIRPLSNDGDGMAYYLDGLTQTPEVVCAVFRAMADPQNYPMIIHCSLGADRTGEIVAMLEAILGCSEEHIVRDYTWSSLSTIGIRDTTFVPWNDFIAYVKSFDPENSTVQEGSRNFLQSIGVSEQELAGIRSIFLDNGCPSYSELPDYGGAAARHASSKHRQNRPSIIISPHRYNRHASSGTHWGIFDLSGRRVSGNSGNDLPVFLTERITRLAPGGYIVPPPDLH